MAYTKHEWHGNESSARVASWSNEQENALTAAASGSDFVAATTLGTVTGKVEVFDSDGNSLGFLPVYDSIT